MEKASISLSPRCNFTILFIAFFHSEFAKERERAENRRAFFKFRSREKLERQFTAYSDWIGRAGKKNVTSTSAHINKQTINCSRFTIQFSQFERALFNASLSWYVSCDLQLACHYKFSDEHIDSEAGRQKTGAWSIRSFSIVNCNSLVL